MVRRARGAGADPPARGGDRLQDHRLAGARALPGGAVCAVRRGRRRVARDVIMTIALLHCRSGPSLPRRLLRDRPAPGGARRGTADRGGPVLRYLVHRLLIMVPTLVGDQHDRLRHHPAAARRLPRPPTWPSCRRRARASSGEKIDFLRELYGLDRPLWQQYLLWLGGLLHGDLGYSFEYDQPVSDVIGDRMFLTISCSFATILFTWVVSFPIGVYSATHKYSCRRPHADLPRLPRPRHAQLPAGAGPALPRQRLVRHLDRRPDGPGISRPADELGQVRLGARAPVGAGDRDRHRRAPPA